MGKDGVLFHYTDDGDPESVESTFVVQVHQWFDSVSAADAGRGGSRIPRLLA